VISVFVDHFGEFVQRIVEYRIQVLVAH
jgi:hypothetical protein